MQLFFAFFNIVITLLSPYAMQHSALILHEHKTGKAGVKRLVLGARGFALIQGLPRHNNYIFYGRAGIGRITEATRPWGITRENAGIPHTTIHDLHRTFASVAVSSGVSMNDTGILLGHKELSTTGIYAIADIHRRQKLINDVEQFMYDRLYHHFLLLLNP